MSPTLPAKHLGHVLGMIIDQDMIGHRCSLYLISFIFDEKNYLIIKKHGVSGVAPQWGVAKVRCARDSSVHQWCRTGQMS
jgi:hypothetical protein